MIVAKFGGTSVSSKGSVNTLCKIVANELHKHPVIVVSALSRVTDILLTLATLPRDEVEQKIHEIKKIHKDLILSLWDDKNLLDETILFINSKLNELIQFLIDAEPGKAFMDELVSYGEILSSYIITRALENQGIKAVQIIATELIITDNNFGSAEFLVIPTKRRVQKVLKPILKAGIVPVVTGFIASTKKGEITTLGRGGSDYTASIIGYSLKAKEIQIWTDVDGIFTSDPRFVENARPLKTVSFKEASELAAFGARVLHPRTIRPAISAGIPVKVLNTFNPENEGTLIEEKSSITGKLKAVSFKRKIILVNIYSTDMLLAKGFLAKVFKIFGNNDIVIDLVSVSEVSVSVSVDNKKNLENAVRELSLFSNITVIEDLGMVSLIGEEVTSSTKTIRAVFEILDREKILARMISLSAANINISIVVKAGEVEKTVRVLHDRLLLKHIH